MKKLIQIITSGPDSKLNQSQPKAILLLLLKT